MIPTTNTVTTEAPAGVLSLHDIAARTGVSIDVLRARLRANPHLRAMFTMIGGRVHVLPAASLPAVLEVLKLAPRFALAPMAATGPSA